MSPQTRVSKPKSKSTPAPAQETSRFISVSPPSGSSKPHKAPCDPLEIDEEEGYQHFIRLTKEYDGWGEEDEGDDERDIALLMHLDEEDDRPTPPLLDDRPHMLLGPSDDEKRAEREEDEWAMPPPLNDEEDDWEMMPLNDEESSSPPAPPAPAAAVGPTAAVFDDEEQHDDQPERPAPGFILALSPLELFNLSEALETLQRAIRATQGPSTP
jgi:hypothetical protein